MPAITVENLSKTYPGKVEALKDINFTVDYSEIFGFVGPDGAGKSTLFNILTTLLFPNTGKVTLLSLDLEADYLEVRHSIGYLPGTFSLYPDLTVEENLLFFATMYKSRIKDNMPMIRPIWKQLVPFKDRRAGKLSGGMKQKLALCCALIHKPRILFLDEPTTGVDPYSRKEFWDILKSIQKQDVTVVVSTPYMDEANRCDRIALIQKGSIIKIDTPFQVVSDFKGELYSVPTNNIFELLKIMENCPLNCNYYPYGEHLHVVFYEENGNALSSFHEFLDGKFIPEGEICRIEPTIEDCFIELMKMK